MAVVGLVWGWVTGSGFISALRKRAWHQAFGHLGKVWLGDCAQAPIPKGFSSLWHCAQGQDSDTTLGWYNGAISFKNTKKLGLRSHVPNALWDSTQGWKYGTEPRGGTSVSPWRSSRRVELHCGVHHHWIKAHPLGSGWDKAPTPICLKITILSEII